MQSDNARNDRLKEVLRSIAAVADRKLKVHKLALELRRLRPEAAADLLTDAVAGADLRDARCQEFCLLLASGVRVIRESVGASWWDRFSAAAGERTDPGLSALMDELDSGGGWLFAIDDEEQPTRLEMSLGHKKSAARKQDPFLLDRLLYETDLGVVGNLLDNPRLTEREVVRMASHRPVDPDILSLISSHHRWNSRYAVKKSLVFNPWTPPRVVVSLIPHLLLADLELLFANSRHTLVRRVVERVVIRKYQALTPEEQRQFLERARPELLDILMERVHRSLGDR